MCVGVIVFVCMWASKKSRAARALTLTPGWFGTGCRAFLQERSHLRRTLRHQDRSYPSPVCPVALPSCVLDDKDKHDKV